MTNWVLYRKYRPQTFTEMTGQEIIVKTIQNAIAKNRQAHGYLFCGPRGVGKTTLARLMAKAINCENRKTGQSEPCNQCASCQSIMAARALDLVEIDAASNRGIDEIRDLKEGIRFSPSQLKYKVFIIDEVHMLTREAFNALLKTLEEPPAHAIFILATTEAHKVPETIISRCQRFDFARLPLEKIIERLAHIAQQEKIKIDKQALEMIALNSTGGMRDAESLLGQIMAVQDKEITGPEVREILGAVDDLKIKDFMDILIADDESRALDFINQLLEEGHNLHQFIKAAINYLRKVLILGVDEKLQKVAAVELTAKQAEIIVAQSRKLGETKTLRLIGLLIEAGTQTKNAPIIQLPLELAVLKFLQK